MTKEHHRLIPTMAVLTLAVVLRCVALWKYGALLEQDRDAYRAIAQEIAAGRGFADLTTHLPTAYRPPLYPLVLAAVLGCGGGDAAIGALHVVLGAGTTALTILLGLRLGLGRASYLAGVLVAVDPLLLHNTALVMTETLAAFLTVLLLWFAVQPEGVRHNLLVGATFGLCCLCRPTYLAAGPVFLIGCWWARRRQVDERSPETRDPPWPPLAKGGRTMIAVAVGALIVVSPWVVRNALVMGRPIVATTHGGYTLLLGHNPAYYREVVDRPWGAVFEGEPQAAWAKEVEEELARETPPLDVAHLSPEVEMARDGWMNRRAWETIRSDPGAAIRAGLTLLGRLWNITPLSTGGAPNTPTIRWIIGTFYAATFGAVAFGSWRLTRSEWRIWWPVIVLPITFTLVHSLYWADMRMRGPLVPCLAVLAARGVCRVRAANREVDLQITPSGG